jgi:hypothetical protein
VDSEVANEADSGEVDATSAETGASEGGAEVEAVTASVEIRSSVGSKTALEAHRLMHQEARDTAAGTTAGTTAETTPALAVGMTRVMAVAHMMTGRAAEAAIVTVNHDEPAATWSPSVQERVVGIETTATAATAATAETVVMVETTATTTDPGITTHANASMTGATKSPGKSAATDRNSLFVSWGLSFPSPFFSLLVRSSLPCHRPQG